MRVFPDIEAFSFWISENSPFSAPKARTFIECGLISDYAKDHGKYIVSDDYTIPVKALSEYKTYTMTDLVKETGVDAGILQDAFTYFRPVRKVQDKDTFEEVWVFNEDEIEKLREEAPSLSEKYVEEASLDDELMPEFLQEYESAVAKEERKKQVNKSSKTGSAVGRKAKKAPKKKLLRKAKQEAFSDYGNDLRKDIYEAGTVENKEEAKSFIQRSGTTFIPEEKSIYTEASVNTDSPYKEERTGYSYEGKEVVAVERVSDTGSVRSYGAEAVYEQRNKSTESHETSTGTHEEAYTEHKESYESHEDDKVKETTGSHTEKDSLYVSETKDPLQAMASYGGIVKESYIEQTKNGADSPYRTENKITPTSQEKSSNTGIYYVMSDGSKVAEKDIKDDFFKESTYETKGATLKENTLTSGTFVDNTGKKSTITTFGISGLENGTYKNEKEPTGVSDRLKKQKEKIKKTEKLFENDPNNKTVSGLKPNLSIMDSNKQVYGIKVRKGRAPSMPRNTMGRIMTRPMQGMDMIRGAMMIGRYYKIAHFSMQFMTYKGVGWAQKKNYKGHGKTEFNAQLRKAGINNNFLHDEHGKLKKKLSQSQRDQAKKLINERYKILIGNSKLDLCSKSEKSLLKLRKDAYSHGRLAEVSAIDAALSLKGRDKFEALKRQSGMKLRHSVTNLMRQMLSGSDFVRGVTMCYRFLHSQYRAGKFLKKHSLVLKGTKKASRVMAKGVMKTTKKMVAGTKMDSFLTKKGIARDVKSMKKKDKLRKKKNKKRTGWRGKARKRMRNSRVGRARRKLRVRRHQLGKTKVGKAAKSLTKVTGSTFGFFGKLFSLPGMILKGFAIAAAVLVLIVAIVCVLAAGVILLFDIFPSSSDASSVIDGQTVIEAQGTTLEEINKKWIQEIVDLPTQLKAKPGVIKIYNGNQYRNIKELGQDFNLNQLSDSDLIKNDKGENVMYYNTKEIEAAATIYCNSVGITDEKEINRICEQLFWHSHAYKYTVRTYGEGENESRVVDIYISIAGSVAVDGNFNEKTFTFDNSICDIDNEYWKLWKEGKDTKESKPEATDKPGGPDEENGEEEAKPTKKPKATPKPTKEPTTTVEGDDGEWESGFGMTSFCAFGDKWNPPGFGGSYGTNVPVRDSGTKGYVSVAMGSAHDRWVAGGSKFIIKELPDVIFCVTDIGADGYFSNQHPYGRKHIDVFFMYDTSCKKGQTFSFNGKTYTVDSTEETVTSGGKTIRFRQWMNSHSWGSASGRNLHIKWIKGGSMSGGSGVGDDTNIESLAEKWKDEYSKEWKGYDKSIATDWYISYMEVAYKEAYEIEEPDKYYDLIKDILDEATKHDFSGGGQFGNDPTLEFDNNDPNQKGDWRKVLEQLKKANPKVCAERWAVVEKAFSLTNKMVYYDQGPGTESDHHYYGRYCEGPNPKSLDCSSFVAWAYYRCCVELDKKLYYLPGKQSYWTGSWGTEIFSNNGQGKYMHEIYNRKSLLPGDVGLGGHNIGSSNVHATMFAGRDSKGNEVWVHCTSSNSDSGIYVGHKGVYDKNRPNGTDVGRWTGPRISSRVGSTYFGRLNAFEKYDKLAAQGKDTPMSKSESKVDTKHEAIKGVNGATHL